MSSEGLDKLKSHGSHGTPNLVWLGVRLVQGLRARKFQRFTGSLRLEVAARLVRSKLAVEVATQLPQRLPQRWVS